MDMTDSWTKMRVPHYIRRTRLVDLAERPHLSVEVGHQHYASDLCLCRRRFPREAIRHRERRACRPWRWGHAHELREQRKTARLASARRENKLSRGLFSENPTHFSFSHSPPRPAQGGARRWKSLSQLNFDISCVVLCMLQKQKCWGFLKK